MSANFARSSTDRIIRAFSTAQTMSQPQPQPKPKKRGRNCCIFCEGLMYCRIGKDDREAQLEKAQHVLGVAVDGARGTVVRNTHPPAARLLAPRGRRNARPPCRRTATPSPTPPACAASAPSTALYDRHWSTCDVSRLAGRCLVSVRPSAWRMVCRPPGARSVCRRRDCSTRPSLYSTPSYQTSAIRRPVAIG